MLLDSILKLAHGLWIYAISLSIVLKLASTVQVSGMLLVKAKGGTHTVVYIWIAFFVTSECWEHEGIQRLIASDIAAFCGRLSQFGHRGLCEYFLNDDNYYGFIDAYAVSFIISHLSMRELSCRSWNCSILSTGELFIA